MCVCVVVVVVEEREACKCKIELPDPSFADSDSPDEGFSLDALLQPGQTLRLRVCPFIIVFCRLCEKKKLFFSLDTL